MTSGTQDKKSYKEFVEEVIEPIESYSIDTKKLYILRGTNISFYYPVERDNGIDSVDEYFQLQDWDEEWDYPAISTPGEWREEEINLANLGVEIRLNGGAARRVTFVVESEEAALKRVVQCRVVARSPRRDEVVARFEPADAVVPERIGCVGAGIASGGVVDFDEVVLDGFG